MLCGIDVSTGFLAGIRGRAARKLEKSFQAHMQTLLASAPVLHADETSGRVAGALASVHVACTEYLTLMHVGDRSAATIDAGGVLPSFTGVLVRDGYTGYAHLPAIHAWCAAHLLRDLRSISDADPDGQLWATAMATTLTHAHHAAIQARDSGAEALDEATLKQIRNHYHGALARGDTDNHGLNTSLADKARTLITRFSTVRRHDPEIRHRPLGTLHQQRSQTSSQTRQNPATHLRRRLAHPARTHRLRHRAVLPGHRHQMGNQQTRRPPPTLHHRRMATPSTHTS
jgi:hypothetical protein